MRMLVESEEEYFDTVGYCYFFVVYTVEDGLEKEVGKVITTVKQVDEAIGWTRWPERDHESMGKQSAKDVSWTALLDRLGLSESAFRDADVIDLTTREIE